MKITYFSHSTIPSQAANSMHVVFMSAAMAKIGGVVQLFSWPSQARDRNLNRHEMIEHYNISSTIYHRHYAHLKIPGFSFISALIAAFKTVASGQDLIIGRYIRPCFFAALFGKSVIFETHQPLSTMPWVDRLMLTSLARSRSCLGIVTISEPLLKILETEMEKAGDNASPIIVAPDAANPVNPQNSINLNPDFNFHVAYIGSLHKGRGVDIIVALAQSISDCCFHIAGGTEAEVIKWQRITNDLPNIVFHGHLTTRDAEALRISCECLLAPYQLDTQVPGGMNTSRWMSPMKLFEYLAAGKAIICSDIPVLHEAVTHEETAIMVSPENLNEWVAAVSLLRDDEALRKKLGRAAENKHRMGGSWEDRCRNIFAALGVDLHQGTIRKRR